MGLELIISPDHGGLTGLSDDDHTLYIKADGTRAFTGVLDLGQNAILETELASDPTTPASTKWKLYFKSGGLYHVDDLGAIVGPLGTGGGSGAPFIDSTAIMKGSVDATKLLAIEVDGLTTATTRTWTVQDVSGTVLVTGGADVTVADGGTGASDAATARTNLGVAIGTDIQAFDADLTAVAGLATNGLVARTGTGTAATRTVTGTANQVVVSNGDGVSGNPTLSTPQDIGTASSVAFRQVGLNGSISGTLTVAVPATTTSHTLTLPSAQGGASTVLTNNGAGALSWGAAGGGVDATISSTDHYGGASSSDGVALGTWMGYGDAVAEINGMAGRVSASSSFPQRVVVAGKLRAVSDATTATTTLSGGAGARYIMADVSATATTFTLTNDTDNTPTSTEKLIGVAYWDGAATKILKTLDGSPFLYAYQSSGQSLPDSTTTVLTIDTEVYDSHGAYNAGTYTWTCPEDGHYIATGVLTTTAAPGNNNHVWTKTGTVAGFFYFASSSINARSLSVFADMFIKGDTLTFATRPNGALTSSAGVNSTYLAISKAGV